MKKLGLHLGVMWVTPRDMSERLEGCYWLLERRLLFEEVLLSLAGQKSPMDQRKKFKTQ